MRFEKGQENGLGCGGQATESLPKGLHIHSSSHQ